MNDDRPPRRNQSIPTDHEVLQRISERTRRSFLVGAGAVATAAVGYGLASRGKPIGMLRRPLRAAEDFNAAVSEHIIGETALAPTFPEERALTNPRPNGPFGLRKDLDPASWRLQLTGLAAPQKHPLFAEDVSGWKYNYSPAFADISRKLDGNIATPSGSMILNNNKLGDSDISGSPTPSRPLPPSPGLLLSLNEIQALPFVKQTTEFKCVEGWSEIVTFAGVRFRDFIKLHPPFRNPDGSLPRYAAMTSIDGAYFCGFEMAALLHPQTLLCFQMSGRDLTASHGAPLRLAMPLKYGYKQIKQIARITYTNIKPDDFWANLGYDWHGGL